ncbi:hypothetical protein M3E13_16600 [Oceanobacillus kimchii]|uniref:hypothetical protein n=1 Tax=Oceanobacillus TaxID=182709 RepID=UPI0021A4803C|nr:hypothetical protein [Oceanobacillus kimchii]MCT1577954.1 hypothetical protein [Oceanobacillus kimchii]MCT2137514.1 hypothetical protein [Oceanobacillus kimchii]
MPYFRKDNVVLKENNEGRIKELLAMGYQKADEKGKVLGKKKEETVAKSTHEKVVKENKELKEKVKQLEKEQQEENKKASSK